ncbi:cytochrome P450 6B1-like [Phymastichus coffea]|uniref:cytochrome P450 6B1-like n=1 Tax=Phymastichus coffea TaxID=108790 RepID=UPI00273C7837|nr:cytochrome P450 6B1-like [Phymastichus coffea]
MEISIIEIIAGIGVLVMFLYYRFTANYNFWKNLKIIGPDPIPFFGNSQDFILGRLNVAILSKKFYDEYQNEPYVGVYEGSTPKLIMRDLDLIKDILIKDFHLFPDRGILNKENRDPFEENLVNVEYDQWRVLRSNLSPSFTSGKLKDMFHLITECAQNFEKHVAKIARKGEPVECGDLAAKYTTDAIGVCAFGLNINSLGDENSGFRMFGKCLTDMNWRNVARHVCRDVFPRFYAFIRPLVYNRAEDFFINSIKETMNYRKKNKIRRKDFVDILVDLQEQRNGKLKNLGLTDELLRAQAFVFFFAGFHSTSTIISHVLYELALHPLIQDKLREEIRGAIVRDGKLTYDNIKEMKYFDKIIKETLRKYPPFNLQRRSAVDYTFEGTKVTIPKGTRLVIPVWGIQRDPNIWPDPDVFDPERFNEENEKVRHPMSYLTFGGGPRNCIGIRFSTLQMKIGIATLICKFKVDTCDKTCIPYRVQARGVIPRPIGGLQLKFIDL